jgi:ribosome-associated toxin RatA of RatAB toxin-antitoxin module
MTTVHHSAILPYTVANMYDLVNDVERYPHFLPWCKEVILLQRNEDEIRATLVLGLGGVQKSFTTCNRLQSHKMIEMRLVEGPFRHLEGFWRFEKVEEGCEIIFDLEFEFSNKLFTLALGPVFNQATNSLVEAFCKRAHELYGK